MPYFSFRISVPGASLRAFLETDNNTEPLRRTTMVQSSFYRKALAYWQYWADEMRPKGEPMVVFTIAKTPERAHALRLTAQAIDVEGRGLHVFWFTSEDTWDISAPERFLYEPIWTTAAGERQAIFGAAAAGQCSPVLSP